MDHEIIEATVSNSGDALNAVAQTSRSTANPSVFRQRQGRLAARLQFSWRRTRRFGAGRDGDTGGPGGRIEKISNGRTSGCSSAPARWTSGKLFQDAGQNRLGGKLCRRFRRTTRIGWNARKSRRARPSANAKRKFPRKRWPNWSAASGRTRASLKVKLKKFACSPASGRKLNSPT